MPIKRKYNFRPGTTIASTHMNEELDQLIAAANNIEAADNKKDTDLRKIAQLFKLTRDDGTIKRLPEKTNLNTVVEAGAYYVGTTSFINSPVEYIGVLEVLPFNATAVLQRYTVMSTTAPRVFVRYGSNGWSKWVELVTSEIDPWISIYLRSGWENYSSYVTRYYKNPLNIVELRGYITGGTKKADTLLFTLPENYRPGGAMVYPAAATEGSGVRAITLKVSTNGEVRLHHDIPDVGFITLDGISFRAER